MRSQKIISMKAMVLLGFIKVLGLAMIAESAYNGAILDIASWRIILEFVIGFLLVDLTPSMIGSQIKYLDQRKLEAKR